MPANEGGSVSDDDWLEDPDHVCGLIYFEDGAPEAHHECGAVMSEEHVGWAARLTTKDGYAIFVCPEHADVGFPSRRSLDWWLDK